MTPPTGLDRSSEELDEVAACLVGRFLRHEVPAGDRFAANVLGPGPPDIERLVPAGDGTGETPEDQGRAGDPSLPAVRLVLLVVERGSCAVLLADGVDGAGVAELCDVLCSDLRRESARHVRPRVEHVVDDDIGRSGDQSLRHRLGGGEEGPDPEPETELHVRLRYTSPVGTMSSTARRATTEG